MRTPVPIHVQAELAEVERGFEVGFDEEEELIDEDDLENEDRAARESASNEAPWAPVPLRPARDFVKQDAGAAIDIVFPTVYEEDRTAKLKDLITAQAAGIITHQRMAEQAAKELGFETYVYSDELQSILDEMKKLPPALLGAADAIAGATKGGGGAAGGGGISIGAPASGITSERRGDLSGDSTADFRRQQRSMVSTTEARDEDDE